MPTSYDLKTYSSVTFTHLHNSWIASSLGSTSGTSVKTFISKRDIKTGVSNKDRLAFFMLHGYLPIQPYVRVVDELTPLQWGASISNIGAPYTPAVANLSVSDHRALNFADLTNQIHLPITDPLFNTLRLKAIAKANAKTIEHNAGIVETLFELRKTKSMFIDAATTVVRAMRHIRRGRFAEAAKTLGMSHVPNGVSRKRSAASNWLEYRYGWLPCISSVESAAKATYDLYSRSRFIRHSRGYAEGSAPYWSGFTDYSTWNQDYNIASLYVPGEYAYGGTTHRGVNYHVLRKYWRDLRVDVGYVYKITNPNLVYSSQLGLTNPLSVAWELVPLSFVADWFVNVGDVLDQLGTFTGKQFLAGYVTYSETVRAEIKGKLSSYNPPTGFTNTGWKDCILNRKSFRIERTVLTSPPYFGLQLNVELNQKRMVDAIALVRQMFR